MDNALVLVFLGNPGREYAQTRHNAAWLVADRLTARLDGSGLNQVPPGPLVWTVKFEGSLATVSLNGKKLYLFKPQNFMNLSGVATRKLVDFYKLGPESVVAIHDDLELAYGQLAFRKGGGAGGHNGLRSLDSHLGSPNYLRCRIGIGRPIHGSVADFVLARWTPDEEIVLPMVLDTAADALLDFVNKGKLPPGRLQAFQATKPKPT
jgi:PTH1 family peptidyl-tRNA hydrolase